MAGPSVFPPSVSGVILAAGRSRRFPGRRPKQLHVVGGQTLVARTARVALASRLRQVIVVTGYRAPEVGAALAGFPVEVVVNRRYLAGQSTSVSSGLAHISPEAEAAIFIPTDLPRLETFVLDRLIEAFRDSGRSIVVPTIDGGRRAPVLIARGLFGEVASISGDQGARQLFPDHETEIVEVAFDGSHLLEDLDR